MFLQSVVFSSAAFTFRASTETNKSRNDRGKPSPSVGLWRIRECGLHKEAARVSVCVCDIVVEARPHPREEVKGHGAEQRNRGMFGQRLKDIRK